MSPSKVRVLPREHGATVIWFSSLLLAFGLLREPPTASGVVLFLSASVFVLILTTRLTGGSIAVARLERNRTLLPLLSGILSLIVPFGQIVMVGQLSPTALAVWLVFLTYSSAGVVYTQDLVRSVLNETRPTWTSLGLSGVVVAGEVAAFSAFNWLSIAAIAIIVPLIVNRLVVLLLTRRTDSPRIRRIRRVGFAQAGNLIAVVVILAVVSRV